MIARIATANPATPTAGALFPQCPVQNALQETLRNHAVGSNRITSSRGKHAPNSLQSVQGLVKRECSSQGQCVIKLEAADVPDGDLYNYPIFLLVCLEFFFFVVVVLSC